MFKPKIVEYIKNLSQRDLRELNFMASSSILGGEDKHKACLDYIKSTEKFDKLQVFALCFPNENFNDVKLRLFLSELIKIIEKFLAIKKVISDKDYIAKSTLEALKDKGSEALFNKILAKDKKRLASTSVKNDDYFDQLGYLYIEEYEFNYIKKRTQNLHLQDMLDTLEQKHAIEILRILTISISHAIVSGHHYDITYMQRNAEHFRSEKYSNNATLQLFLYCHTILTEAFDESTFEKLIFELSKNIDKIEEKDAKSIYTIIINFCIRNFNFGNKAFGEKAIQLYISGIENKVLLTNGKISKYTYRNMITLGIKCHQLGLAKQICENYQLLISTTERSDSYDFGMAMIDYEERNWASAQSRLLKVTFNDPLFTLAAKTTLLKIFFHTSEFDLLTFHMDAMRMYIMRKKVIGYHKENYINILNFMKKLLNHHRLNNAQKKQLSEEINNTTPLTEKEWFLEKLK